VVRNWGALIALVGGMLIFGAFNPLQRPLVLIVAGASKVIFIALVLSEGTRYLSYQAGVAVAGRFGDGHPVRVVSDRRALGRHARIERARAHLAALTIRTVRI
jgi:hypothetical protein